MTTPTLIYFPARGRAEVIRLILAEAGVVYTEHHVGKGTPPQDGRPTDFTELKATGQLAFNAVPVWEEADGFRLAQSHAIANHLGRQYGLMGKTLREQALVEQALGGVEDARVDLRRVVAASPEQRPAVRAEILSTTAPRWLGHFERLLSQNGGGAGFLVGDALTTADLALWFLVETYEANGFGAAVAHFPLVAAHFQRIGSRERIAGYLASPKRPPAVLMPK